MRLFETITNEPIDPPTPRKEAETALSQFNSRWWSSRHREVEIRCVLAMYQQRSGYENTKGNERNTKGGDSSGNVDKRGNKSNCYAVEVGPETWDLRGRAFGRIAKRKRGGQIKAEKDNNTEMVPLEACHKPKAGAGVNNRVS